MILTSKKKFIPVALSRRADIYVASVDLVFKLPTRTMYSQQQA